MCDELDNFHVRQRGRVMTQRPAAGRFPQTKPRLLPAVPPAGGRPSWRRIGQRGFPPSSSRWPRQRCPLALPAPPVRLCLPAPSQEPMFILPDERPERELVPVAPAPREELKRLAA